MKKLLLVIAALLMVAPEAHASGWVSDYDCGSGVTASLSGWHGKIWFDMEGLGNANINQDDITDVGLYFHYRIQWHKKVVTFRLVDGDATFNGHPCKSLGDPRYPDREKK
jgi:hypothetical protein